MQAGNRLRRLKLSLLAASTLLLAPSAEAQSVRVRGTSFVDYYYNASSPEPAREGLHGFTYRRLYLTTDFTLTESFRGRARLEASEATSGSKGPMPFVKDLFLRWESKGGHRVTGGVQPPPAYDLTEDVWDYRSLEKTIMDLVGVLSSRDFGLRADGPIAAGGKIAYSIMYGNNSGSRVEEDAYKRVYGQLRFFPFDPVTIAAGASYAGYGDARTGEVLLHALAGYTASRLRAGVEGFIDRVRYADESVDARNGISFFSAYALSETWSVVGRLDLASGAAYDTAIIAGVSYRPAPPVRLMPNLLYLKPGGSRDPLTQVRMTLELDF